MIDVKNEMRYILVTRLLEQAAEDGLLSAEELWAAKRLALERYRPRNCVGIVLDIPAKVW